jgi:hypothetical protein
MKEAPIEGGIASDDSRPFSLIRHRFQSARVCRKVMHCVISRLGL